MSEQGDRKRLINEGVQAIVEDGVSGPVMRNFGVVGFPLQDGKLLDGQVDVAQCDDVSEADNLGAFLMQESPLDA